MCYKIHIRSPQYLNAIQTVKAILGSSISLSCVVASTSPSLSPTVECCKYKLKLFSAGRFGAILLCRALM